MAIVERALEEAPLAADDQTRGKPRIVGYDRRGQPIVRVGYKTVEQVAADIQARFPDGIGHQISSIDIIRQDRDSR